MQASSLVANESAWSPSDLWKHRDLRETSFIGDRETIPGRLGKTCAISQAGAGNSLCSVSLRSYVRPDVRPTFVKSLNCNGFKGLRA